MSLADVQTRFHAFLMSGDSAPDAVRDLFVALPEASLRRRLAVYAESVRQKTGSRMATYYCRTVSLVGREAFQALVDQHVAGCHAGAVCAFDDVLRTLPETLERESAATGRPDLGALASVERARHEVAQHAPLLALGPEALHALPAEGLGARRLRLVPALAVVETRFDVGALWEAIDAGQPAPAPQPAASAYVVFQHDGAVAHRALEADEHAALTRARAGATLDEVCGAFEGSDDPEAAASAALFSWFEDGLVADVA